MDPIIVGSRGWNPENPSDRRPGMPTEQRLEPNSQGVCNTLTSVQKDNLVLEPVTTSGNTVPATIRSSIYKNGARNIIENLTNKRGYGGVLEPCNTGKDGTSRTLKARDYKNSSANYTGKDGMGATGVIHYNGKACRVRKLTPLECWRLMGFEDADFIKAATLNPSDEYTRNILMSHELTGLSVTDLLEGREKKTSTSNSQLYKQAGNSIVVDVLVHLFSCVKAAAPEAFERKEG